MKKLLILTIVFFVLTLNSFAQIKSILEKVSAIRTLESTEKDVREVFKSFKSEKSDEFYRDIFYPSGYEIQFDYSKGKCTDYSNFFDFEVAERKVIAVTITPENPILLKDFGFDISKFKKEKMYRDVEDAYVFHNKNNGMMLRINNGKIEEIKFIPPRRYYSLMCDQEFAARLLKKDTIFKEDLEYRNSIPICLMANVLDLKLSKKSVENKCPDLGEERNTRFSKKTLIINVSTIAVDPENDVLTYKYTISAGKITGRGAKVLWDLTGVKAGTYTITAAVDDGCGYCGFNKTKSIVIKECNDYK